MAFDNPSDMAWIFIIFAAVVITFGFGLTSVQEYQNVTQTTTFFSSIEGKVMNNQTGLKAAADAQESSIVGQEGASEEPSVANIFVRSWNSIREIMKVWSVFEDSAEESFEIIGLDPIYWTLITSGLLITFAVILYSWVRFGGGGA